MEELVNQLNDLPTSTIEVRASDAEHTPDRTEIAPICQCQCSDCSR
ncbi:hypothetical protein [Actinomadura oligospora]|nr:hypothetical protein [Actinomadura oligospora]